MNAKDIGKEVTQCQFLRNNERKCDWRPRKQERKWTDSTYKLKGPKTFLSKAEYIIRDIVSRRETNL